MTLSIELIRIEAQRTPFHTVCHYETFRNVNLTTPASVLSLFWSNVSSSLPGNLFAQRLVKASVLLPRIPR